MTETQAAARIEACAETPAKSGPTPRPEEVREGRRFSVGSMRGQARARVRYIEGNHPVGGCRFLG